MYIYSLFNINFAISVGSSFLGYDTGYVTQDCILRVYGYINSMRSFMTYSNFPLSGTHSSSSSSSSSSSLVTENHQRTDVYFPAHAW